MTVRTRRVVTGHSPDGRSVVLEDASVPNVRAVPGARFDEVWSTGSAPERLGRRPNREPTSSTPRIGPVEGGSAIRIIEFAPVGRGGMRSPMHRTATIDYGIVIEGEVTLILSDSEVALRQGDVVVQRGTDHAWENRSTKRAKMAFVLIDAALDDDLSELIGDSEIMS